MPSALGIQKGNRINGCYIVSDVSYSEHYVYAHCHYRATARSALKRIVMQFKPFDEVSFTTGANDEKQTL